MTRPPGLKLAYAVGVAFLVCAGCTSDPQAGPTTTATGPSASVASESSAGSASSASSVVETTGPWPPGSTPEQQAAATAAIAAFDNYVKVVIATQQDPAGRDWEPEIRKYLADPAAANLVESTLSLAKGEVHVVDPASY